MSSKFYKKSIKADVKHVIQSVVNNGHQNLADFVRQKISDNELSYRDVAARSNGLISHGTVGDIISGKNLNPSPKTIKGLAKGLNVSEDELFNIVRGKKLSDDEYEESLFQSLYYKHNRLTPRKKAEFKRILEMVDRELDRLEQEESKETKS